MFNKLRKKAPVLDRWEEDRTSASIKTEAGVNCIYYAPKFEDGSWDGPERFEMFIYGGQPLNIVEGKVRVSHSVPFEEENKSFEIEAEARTNFSYLKISANESREHQELFRHLRARLDTWAVKTSIEIDGYGTLDLPCRGFAIVYAQVKINELKARIKGFKALEAKFED